MTETALARGQAAIVGEGRNEFGYVNNGECNYPSPFSVSFHTNNKLMSVADLFMLLFDAASNKPDSCGHGREGVYYASAGVIAWRVLNEAVGEGLVKTGKLTSAKVSSLTVEERDLYLPYVSLRFIFPFPTVLQKSSR